MAWSHYHIRFHPPNQLFSEAPEAPTADLLIQNCRDWEFGKPHLLISVSVLLMCAGIWTCSLNTGGFPGGSVVKNLPVNEGDAGDPGLIPGLGRPPGEGNGTPLSIPVWKIPWTEESGGLQAVGSQSQMGMRNWAHTHLSTSFLLGKPSMSLRSIRLILIFLKIHRGQNLST